MSQLILSRPVVNFVLFVERWLLSAVFLFLAFEYIQTVQLMRLFGDSQDLLPRSLIEKDGGLSDGCHFSDYARYTLLIFSNLASGILLLISRKPTRYPDQAREVVIPLFATFSYMFFNQHIPMPAWMTTPVVSVRWEGFMAVCGLVLSFIGACISLAAILWLGRSMGIVVTARRVVLSGPYTFVRHPIYLGYFFLLAGMFLTAFTVRMLIIDLGAAALLIWRASMEEDFLARYSPTYRDWARHTGFLWFRRPDANASALALHPSNS